MSPFTTPLLPPHCPDDDREYPVFPPPPEAGPGGYAHRRWYTLCGSYYRQDGLKRAQGYRCRSCRRTFSMRTFSLDYWYQHDGLTEEVAHALASCAAYRQVARARQVSVGAVRRRAERIGPPCLLVHESRRPRTPRRPGPRR